MCEKNRARRKRERLRINDSGNLNDANEIKMSSAST